MLLQLIVLQLFLEHKWPTLTLTFNISPSCFNSSVQTSEVTRHLFTFWILLHLSHFNNIPRHSLPIKGSLNLLPSTWTKYHPPLQPSCRAELACIVSVEQPLWWLTALPPENGCASMSFNPKLWFALFTELLSAPFQGKQTTTVETNRLHHKYITIFRSN